MGDREQRKNHRLPIVPPSRRPAIQHPLADIEVPQRERAEDEVRIEGQANDAGFLLDRAELRIGRGRELCPVLGPGEDDVIVRHLAATDQVFRFAYQPRGRFIPVAGTQHLRSAAGDHWLLLRASDGLAFRPADPEHALELLSSNGIKTAASEARLRSWPGTSAPEASADGCISAVVILSLTFLGTWLVSLTGFDFDGPWGRPVALGVFAIVALVLGFIFGRPIQRWRRRSVAQRR